ncbi:CIC11C00000003358 [Sungouiella intermedia]|uniref:CIC11C00000003358 n=1 Tax=Sungouiella intermedia TaxID=45354 RepID=A0A1L0BVX3_9ASCO|nr:CIC11C00000003358 [[Candida] intermedia]
MESCNPFKSTSNTSESPQPTYLPHCIRDKFLIKSQGDVEIIQSCSRISGSIEIRGYSDALLVLDNLQALNGSLSIVQSPNLVRIEAPRLETISNVFHMEKLTSLALVHMPVLTSVTNLEWRVLPILGNINFGNIDGLQSIIISDTSLTGVSGFSSAKLKVVDVNNNRFMESLRSDVGHVSEKLHIAANANNMVVELKSLVSAHNISVHNLASLDISMLEEVKGSINLIANLFSELKMPKLTTVGGTFSISKNEKLQTINLTSLKEVGGGLQINGNLYISKIDFLPKLSIVGGALELVGNIKEVTMKSLKLVKGSARVITSDQNFNCATWKQKDASTVVRGGKVECMILLEKSAEKVSVPSVKALSGASNFGVGILQLMVAGALGSIGWFH